MEVYVLGTFGKVVPPSGTVAEGFIGRGEVREGRGEVREIFFTVVASLVRDLQGAAQ
jgi:hypothetical protein